MTYNVRLSQSPSFKVVTMIPTIELEFVPVNLDELLDVEISGNNDKYVLMYDAASGKWRDVNPDQVLSASSNTEATQPGLPNDFINTLDVDLDNRINLDAGTF